MQFLLDHSESRLKSKIIMVIYLEASLDCSLEDHFVDGRLR